MYKLSALDAGFLYTETERSPQHIATVQILELPMGKTATEFVVNLRSLLLKRLHLVPYFTNRLAPTPFGLDHPVWVRDSSFSIDHHLHTIEVPAPGGQLELESTVARLHETRLDRSRPLWDLWVLTGLTGRSDRLLQPGAPCLSGWGCRTADARSHSGYRSGTPGGIATTGTGCDSGAHRR